MPIFPVEVRHAAEFVGIVRYQLRTPDDGGGGNQQIEGSDPLGAGLQLRAQKGGTVA
jgi:hypothetical protein